MKKHEHDVFPVRLPGGRFAFLQLPTNLSEQDTERIISTVRFVQDCTVDFNKPLEQEASNDPANRY